MKRTFQPKKKKQFRKFGFFSKSTCILKAKILKKRWRLVAF
uniref:Ribosomal protein L34 n=1 Tax=Jakoba libera TaxID=143017 RepID=M4Q9V4_JAKLI|nr:ribosomal protein L34 [Jakoba libera]AGH24192.1 ribosomal protein L34 [Jakoba libera]